MSGDGVFEWADKAPDRTGAREAAWRETGWRPTGEKPKIRTGIRNSYKSGRRKRARVLVVQRRTGRTRS